MNGKRPVSSAMKVVEQIYQNRDNKAGELREHGKKIIGYICSLSPVEILSGAGFVPYLITGDETEPISKGDNYFETIGCSCVRSCIDVAMKGRYHFLDGLVMPEACDCITKAYDILTYYLKPSYAHFVMVPHMTRPASLEFFKTSLNEFKASIEKSFHTEISCAQLKKSIQAYNENRFLMRELYELRKPDPPLLSGTEMSKIAVAQMSIPVEESNELIRSIAQEVKERDGGPRPSEARALLYGWMCDASAFVELVEDSGINVVVDDVCAGLRTYRHDTEMTTDPLEGLAAHYLKGITCPRTYIPRSGTHRQDIENRFGYIRRLAAEFNVNCVILHTLRYCDIFGFDAPDIKNYLQDAGLRVLSLEEDYGVASAARLRGRLEAFREMIC